MTAVNAFTYKPDLTKFIKELNMSNSGFANGRKQAHRLGGALPSGEIVKPVQTKRKTK